MMEETRFPKIINLQTINLLLLVVLTSNLFGGAADLSSVNFKQAGKFITALERDDRGRVWIGTEDEGVLVCAPQNSIIRLETGVCIRSFNSLL